MVKKICFAWMLGMIFIASGCEDLEDTYSDYAGNGLIRYVGKCVDVEVSAGWERLHVEWKNNQDPAVKHIVLSYDTENVSKDTLLDAGTTFCDLPTKENELYEVNVYAVDKNGNRSLSDAKYARPFTYEHESVRSFTTGVIKHFFVGNNLVMFFDQNSESILNVQLRYQNTNGEPVLMDALQNDFDKQYMLLRDVDVSKPIVIERKGKVEGCKDEIDFTPYELTNEWAFSASFRGQIKARYGLVDIDDNFINNTTELEFDYDVMSFEDILYFPNLEKIVLGKNRYLFSPEIVGVYPNTSSRVSALEKSLFVLGVAQELRGLKIERYNQHYFADNITNLTIMAMGNPVIPEHDYLDKSRWTITCSEPCYNSKPENLLDNDPYTWWDVTQHPGLTTYELVIDMQSKQELNGMKIAQVMDASATDFMPNTIEIQVSVDGEIWENFTYSLANTIGNSVAETTIFNLNEPKRARYIKLIVSDQTTDYVAGIKLGDIAFF